MRGTGLFIGLISVCTTIAFQPLYADDFALQQCYANHGKKQLYGFDMQLNAPGVTTRKLDLYVTDIAEVDSSWTVIDVSEESDIISGTLKLPLHTLKHKAYLAGQKLVLIGNGRSYSQLEQEALWLEKNLASKVKIYNGNPALWRYAIGEAEPLELQTITAREFFSESAFGGWQLLETEQQLGEVIGDTATISFGERFLYVGEGKPLPSPPTPELVRVLFILEGGSEALQKFSLEQGIILTAKKQREKNEECNSIR